jgi:hypothetical protein
MGLYLCVFASDESDEDLGGVEVGTYADFGTFRDQIHRRLELGADRGTRFPVLLQHSDSEGEWTVDECGALRDELATIRTELAAIDPPAYGGWQAEAAEHAGHRPTNYSEYFIDVDGEILLDRIADLVRLAVKTQRPIIFM